jgi:hypothetical protein
MPILDITNFSTTAIKTSTGTIDQTDFEWTRGIVNRIGFLGDGSTKYDVDGTNAADRRLGQVRARFKIAHSTRGMDRMNFELDKMEDLEGVVGKLTGKSYGLVETLTYTCTARCTLAQPDRHTVHQSTPLVVKQRGVTHINMTWELLSSWSITSI